LSSQGRQLQVASDLLVRAVGSEASMPRTAVGVRSGGR
jgi:hypothetical protein